MFNRGQFNRMPFDRPAEGSIILFSAGLSGAGEAGSSPIRERLMATKMDGAGSFDDTLFYRDRGMNAALSGRGEVVAIYLRDVGTVAILSGAAELETVYTREIVNGSEMSGGAEMPDAIYIRERLMLTKMNGAGSLSAHASRFHIDTLEFDGYFKPGDRIIINSGKLTMTINGVNGLQHLSGDFLNINSGDNVITYTDEASGRTVRLRVTFRDRFV